MARTARDQEGATDDEKPAVLAAAVPRELHQAARIRAVKEGRPVTKLIEEAVTRYLDEAGEVVPA